MIGVPPGGVAGARSWVHPGDAARRLDLIIEFALRLPATLPNAPAAARRGLRALDGHISADMLDNLELLVSELMANSLRHGGLGEGDWVEVRVQARRGRVEAQVTDPGSGFEPEPGFDLPADRASGWGLYLVDRLATDWGVKIDGQTAVWLVLEDQSAG